MKNEVKRLILTLVVLCGITGFTPSLQGRDGVGLVTYLDWDEMRIDTVMPLYTEVVPLESDYRQYNYTVSIDYPEWGNLTAEETKRVNRAEWKVCEEIEVSASVSVSRKQGMLDISFCPIVYRDGKYKKLLSAIITIHPSPKARQTRRAVSASERYASESVLAKGKWVKISITEDGMYRLTRSALQNMGFTNPDKVRLYGHGGHRLDEVSRPDNEYDDLEEVPLYKSGDNTWLFWGNGTLYWDGSIRIINPYATKAYYFLTEADSPSQIQTTAYEVTPTVYYDTFTDHVLYEKDEFAWYHGGRHLYDGTDYANGSAHTYKLTTHDSNGGERLTIAFTAGANTPTRVEPSVNGNALSTMTLASLGSYAYGTSSTKTTDVSNYSVGNDWTIRIVSNSGNPAHLDYLALHYDRLLKPYQGYVAFSSSNEDAAQFNIVGSGLQVMRIGEPGNAACLVQGTQDGAVYRVVVDDASHRYVDFDPHYAFPQPTVEGTVKNQNLHALGATDMVIIVPTNDKLTAQAERLAEAHRQYDGLRVVVARADQIYNEFSSGTPDATAYRRLMKMLYDRAENEEDMPRYLLLFGDCAWDNRMLSSAWSNKNPDDYLLCFESENSLSDTQCYVMEDYFGLLDDGEGGILTSNKTDLGVGRFPVVSVAEAKMMVDKTISFLSNEYAGNWKNIITILGDDGDENEHMKYADDVAEQIIADNPEMEVRKIMWDAYTRVSTLTSNTYPEVKNLIKKQVEDGTLVINYTGHAATYTLSHEFVLMLPDFASFSGTKLPLWMTAACDVMPFDGTGDNIGETCMLNKDGAAVAFYGTTRTVYASNNLQMNRWFMRYLLGTDAAGRRYRVGDAIRLAKNYLITGDLELAHRENKLHYALLGDPALTFGAPTNRVVLDEVNGIVLADGADLQLKAGQRVEMTGHLENAQGEMLTDFNGVLTARVYDNLETIVCKNNAKASETFEFKNREKVLFNGQNQVEGGQFTLNFVMPVDINFSNESGRVVFYAINDTRDVEANGYSEDFTIGGIDASVDDDKEGPHIYVYLDEEDFVNGGVVGSAPSFVAQLDDESGINYSGSGLGHDLLLTIDDDPETTYVLNDYYTAEFGDYTRGAVAYTIPDLDDGRHRLTFRAWDVLNNTNAVQLDFVVDAAMNPENLQVFDLTGRRFSTTPKRPGVYIVRNGNKRHTAKKIIMRGNN